MKISEKKNKDKIDIIKKKDRKRKSFNFLILHNFYGFNGEHSRPIHSHVTATMDQVKKKVGKKNFVVISCPKKRKTRQNLTTTTATAAENLGLKTR